MHDEREHPREQESVCVGAPTRPRAWARCMNARFELVLDRGTSLSVSLPSFSVPPLPLSLCFKRIKFALHASVRSREAQASHGWRERTLSYLPLLSFSRQISLSTQHAHAQEHTRTHKSTHERARTHAHTHARTHARAHARTRARARAHTRTHAHTRENARAPTLLLLLRRWRVTTAAQQLCCCGSAKEVQVCTSRSRSRTDWSRSWSKARWALGAGGGGSRRKGSARARA